MVTVLVTAISDLFVPSGAVDCSGRGETKYTKLANSGETKYTKLANNYEIKLANNYEILRLSVETSNFVHWFCVAPGAVE